MKTGIRTVWELLRDTYNEWDRDKASRLAAALAYYSVFSLAPVLVIAVAVAGLVFGPRAAQGELMDQIQGLVGDTGARAIQGLLKTASRPASGILATLGGLGMLIVGATGVFVSLQDGLNTVWEVAPPPGRSWWKGFLQDRMLSFALVLGVGFVLLVSLVLSAAMAAAAKYLGGIFHPAPVFQWLNFAVSFTVVTLLFAMIYKVLPDVEISWGDVWIGAAATSLLFSLGKFLIGLYLGHSSIASAYGAAGSLVIVLAWIYYSAQLLFMGAEFTQVYANRYGTRIKPRRNAVPVTPEAKAHQGLRSRAGGSAPP